MVQNNKIDKSLPFFYVILTLLVVVAPLAGGAALVILAMLVFCAALLVLKPSGMFILLMGLFPFANIFKLNPTSSSMLTICELVLCGYIIVVNGILKSTLKFRAMFLFSWLIFVFYLFVVPGGSGGLLPIVKMAVKLMLLYLFFNYEKDKEAQENTTRTMAFVLGISMVLMMTLSQIEPYREKVIDYLRIVQYGGGTEEVRNGGLLNDPNYCSLAIMATLTFLTVLYYFKKINWVYWLLAVPLFIFGFSTYSKSYLLCASSFALLLLLYVLFPRHKGMAVLVMIAAGVGVSMAVSGRIDAINLILDRFESTDITTGRSDLNAAYINYIFNDIKVFMVGKGYNTQTFGTLNNVHNLYIETLFQLGIIGFILFVTVISSCLPRKRNKTKLVNYFPALFVIVMYMALAGLNSYELIYYILIAAGSVLYISDERFVSDYKEVEQA